MSAPTLLVRVTGDSGELEVLARKLRCGCLFLFQFLYMGVLCIDEARGSSLFRQKPCRRRRGGRLAQVKLDKNHVGNIKKPKSNRKRTFRTRCRSVCWPLPPGPEGRCGFFVRKQALSDRSSSTPEIFKQFKWIKLMQETPVTLIMLSSSDVLKYLMLEKNQGYAHTERRIIIKVWWVELWRTASHGRQLTADNQPNWVAFI